MPQAEVFTDTELQRMAALAIDVISEKCRQQPAHLRAFLRHHLHLPEMTLQPVYDRAGSDADYLRSLVAEHINGLHERTVLRLLEEERGQPALAKQLGFDPLDPIRLKAFQGAKQVVNQKQGVVLAVGFLVFILMGLFPPWVEVTRENTTNLIIFREGSKVLSQKFIGYGFAFERKASHTVSSRNNPHGLYGSITVKVTHEWDTALLMAQWIALVVVVGIAFVLLKNKKYSPGEFARRVSSGEGSTAA
jgi:hypothetical protein